MSLITGLVVHMDFVQDHASHELYLHLTLQCCTFKVIYALMEKMINKGPNIECKAKEYLAILKVDRLLLSSHPPLVSHSHCSSRKYNVKM